jgi:hypothetical protein
MEPQGIQWGFQHDMVEGNITNITGSGEEWMEGGEILPLHLLGATRWETEEKMKPLGFQEWALRFYIMGDILWAGL